MATQLSSPQSSKAKNIRLHTIHPFSHTIPYRLPHVFQTVILMSYSKISVEKRFQKSNLTTIHNDDTGKIKFTFAYHMLYTFPDVYFSVFSVCFFFLLSKTGVGFSVFYIVQFLTPT